MTITMTTGQVISGTRTVKRKVILELDEKQAGDLLEVLVHGQYKESLMPVVNKLDPVVRKADKELYQRLMKIVIIRKATGQ